MSSHAKLVKVSYRLCLRTELSYGTDMIKLVSQAVQCAAMRSVSFTVLTECSHRRVLTFAHTRVFLRALDTVRGHKK